MKLKIIVFISTALSLMSLFLATKYFLAGNSCGGCVTSCEKICAEYSGACSYLEYSKQTIQSYLNGCGVHYFDAWLVNGLTIFPS